jgi:predicted dehydrogenase
MPGNRNRKAMGVGVIGCGNISAAYMRFARLFRTIEMRACADLDMKAARARATEFGLKAQTVSELLANPDIDIVVNLTVPAAHFAVSRSILEAGKHVYTEKPLALSFADARELVRLAKKKGLHVAGAPDTFLGGAHQQARKAIDDGLIGKVTSGTAHMMGYGMEHWHPNPDFYYQPGAGPVLDMGPYYVTNLINLVGPVKRVAALSGTARRQRVISSAPRKGERIMVKTPTTYHALLLFANGATITLAASWDVYAHRHQNMELYGTTGAIFVPDPNFFGGAVGLASTDAVVRTLAPWDHPLGVVNEKADDGGRANYRTAGLADMAQAIMARRDIRCSVERMAHAVEVLTAIVKSGETGRFVDLKSTCTRPRPLSPADARALMR